MIRDFSTGAVLDHRRSMDWVRQATRGDIDAIVSIHLRSFPGFFLAFLGPKFLRELYRSILAESSGVLCVAGSKKKMHGFVAGTVEPSCFYRRLIRRRVFHFIVAAIGPTIRRPSILPRLVRALKKPGESRSMTKGTALLMSLAVDPGAQKQGVGRKLVEAFCQECIRRGLAAVVLTTDRDGNEAVNQFYTKLGFTIVRTFTTPEGRVMNEYARELLVDTAHRSSI